MGIFADLTVRENLLLAARSGPIDEARLRWIFGLFPALEKFWSLAAGVLSGGQKQMLSIARAIIEPRKLFLIDEPTKGLAPAIIGNMIAAFQELKKSSRRHHPRRRAEFPVREIARRCRRGHGQRPGSARWRHGGACRRSRPAAAAPRPASGSAPMTARGELSLPAQRRDFVPVLLVPLVALVALPLIGSPSTWVTLTRGRPRNGHDHLHHRLRPYAGVRPDGRAQFRPRRVHHGRRLRGRRAGAAAGVVAARRFDAVKSARAAGADRVRHGGDRRPRLRVRARHHHAGLRPASETDPGHRRRPDRRRATHHRGVWTGADRAAVADGCFAAR